MYLEEYRAELQAELQAELDALRMVTDSESDSSMPQPIIETHTKWIFNRVRLFQWDLSSLTLISARISAMAMDRGSQMVVIGLTELKFEQ